jgi:anion-transporting  ArsA/GET3 family ATPase
MELSIDLIAFVITGMGGVGKTEVAYEYAYSRRNHFNAVMWLNAKNQHSLD